MSSRAVYWGLFTGIAVMLGWALLLLVLMVLYVVGWIILVP